MRVCRHRNDGKALTAQGGSGSVKPVATEPGPMPMDPALQRTHRPWGWFEAIAAHQDSAEPDAAPPDREAPRHDPPVIGRPGRETAVNISASTEPYLVKRLWIHPGARISLQRHRHRCEHWVVVAGSGLLECDGASHVAAPGTTLLIPAGAVHRAGAGDAGLLIIEVQRGELLSEEDIERFADDYGRVVDSKGQPLNKGEAA